LKTPIRETVRRGRELFAKTNCRHLFELSVEQMLPGCGAPQSPTAGLRRQLWFAGILLTVILVSAPQCKADNLSNATPQFGTLIGHLTSDQGIIGAFRVKAHDSLHQLFFTTYSSGSSFQFASLPVGDYEVQVLEPGIQSDVTMARVTANDSTSAEIALRSSTSAGESGRTKYVAFDDLYPPGPGREALFRNCGGCHGRFFFHRRPKDEDGWRNGVESMVNLDIPVSPSTAGNPVRPHLSASDKELIVRYLSTNFPLVGPRRDLKIEDPPLREPDVSQAVYMEYELPPIGASTRFSEVLKDNECSNRCHTPRLRRPPVDANATSIPRPGMAPFAMTHVPRRMLMTPSVDRDQRIWFADVGNNSLLRLDPTILDPTARWREYPVPTSEYVFLHGTAVDREGRVYWTEMHGGQLGELDPQSGKAVRHVLPIPGGGISVVVDAKDNIWYGVSNGMAIGELDGKTRALSTWSTPDLDSNPYGMIVSRKGMLWYADLNNDQLVMFDPKTKRFTKHPTPSRPWGPRRLAEDSKGRLWFSGTMVDTLAAFDPATGKTEQFPFPMKYTQVFEIVVDSHDIVWMSDEIHNCLVKFELSTDQFTYYPLPQFHYYGPPKMELDQRGTLWFGSRDVENITAVAFRSDGNVERIVRQ
jgi:streptogramin lyase